MRHMQHLTRPAWSRRATVLCLLALFCPAATAAAATYTVRPGDSLQAIARRELGDAERWREIARENNLKPPYTIKPGQILELPGRATESLAQSQPSGAAEDESPPASGRSWLWLSIVIGVIAVAFWWLFLAVCLRGACWFSLVETSFGRGASLALYLLLLSVVCVGAWIAVVRMALPERSLPVSVGVVLLLMVAYLIVGLLLTRRTLGCKWRSVLTVLVMTTFLTDLIMFCLWLLLGMLIPALGATALLSNLP